ncbi:hypothetical protein LRP_1870 [Ligilactobacillus ruminis]|nr:hypothetical protein LRP_1870 [Ligilactobacillus ruminis]
MWPVMLGKTLSQIKSPDDLQPIANHPGFRICMTIVRHGGNKKESVFIFAYQNVLYAIEGSFRESCILRADLKNQTFAHNYDLAQPRN